MSVWEPVDSTSLLVLPDGGQVSKRRLFEMIRDSKVPGSASWAGKEGVIGNTPQQGINWIGSWPDIRAVLVKSSAGAYGADGWLDAAQLRYRYSLKAVSGKVNMGEKTNAVLLGQPARGYPVLLFLGSGDHWTLAGTFRVDSATETAVDLQRLDSSLPADPGAIQEQTFVEGGRRFAWHASVERSAAAAAAAKSSRPWNCEICGVELLQRYGVSFIEAHHKVPLASKDSAHEVRAADFALLCPNCHRAVHLHMAQGELDYKKLRLLLGLKLKQAHAAGMEAAAMGTAAPNHGRKQ